MGLYQVNVNQYVNPELNWRFDKELAVTINILKIQHGEGLRVMMIWSAMPK